MQELTYYSAVFVLRAVCEHRDANKLSYHQLNSLKFWYSIRLSWPVVMPYIGSLILSNASWRLSLICAEVFVMQYVTPLANCNRDLISNFITSFNHLNCEADEF